MQNSRSVNGVSLSPKIAIVSIHCTKADNTRTDTERKVPYEEALYQLHGPFRLLILLSRECSLGIFAVADLCPYLKFMHMITG